MFARIMSKLNCLKITNLRETKSSVLTRKYSFSEESALKTCRKETLTELYQLITIEDVVIYPKFCKCLC